MDYQITKDSIQKCFKLEIGQKKSIAHDVDFIFQVLTTKLVKNDGERSMYNCNLSDSHSSYGCFIFVIDKNSQIVEQNDIIKIKSVIHSLMADKKTSSFIVRKFEILGKNCKLIGNPRSKDEIDAEEEKKEIEEIISNEGYLPLKSLNTFSQNFKIKVRVTQKSEIKNFKNANSNGKLLTFTVIDSEGFEMTGIVFNDIADKYNKILSVSRVYEINCPKVKLTDKKFSNSNTNEFKISIEEFTSIKEVYDNGTIKSILYKFVKISDLINVNVNSNIDLVCYLVDVGDKCILRTKTGEMDIKKMIVADSSGYSIEVSLWRDLTTRSDLKSGKYVAFKGLRVGDYNGKKLNSSDSTIISIDPKIPEITELKKFIDNFEGRFKPINEFSKSKNNNNKENVKTLHLEKFDTLKSVLTLIDQMYDEKAGNFYRIKSYVVNFRHDDKNYYIGCYECKKKVYQDTYGYTCPNCNKKMDEPCYIYSFSLKIKDFSAESYIDIFGNCGDRILGIPAKEYKELLESRDDNRLNRLIRDVEHRQYLMLIKPKFQNYNGQVKKRISAVKVESVEPEIERRRLLKEIMESVHNK